VTGHRARGLGYAGLAVAAFGVSMWVLRRLKFGDVDPLSAAIGFLSLLAGVAALVVAVRAWRSQQVDTGQIVEQLAAAVRDKEQQARRQLLGEPGRTIDVRFEFRPAPTHNASNAARRGRLTEVADYYRKLQPSRMVITGPAGAGKTVLAVELMMMLLQDRDPGGPVPVRLSASSWDIGADQSPEPADATRRMQQWLTAHLVDVYQLPQRSAEALVVAGLILPVVDGLDELDATDEPGYASRAGQALRVFNAYQHYRDRAPLIVTCRTGHFQALVDDNLWIEDAARVELRPVTVAQARAFITARVAGIDRWRSVLDRIDQDERGPLAVALSTPWRLTLATVVYDQRRPAGEYEREPHELTSPTLDTPDGIRDHLLAQFLPAALSTVTDQPYDPARAHRWLSVLARYLHQNTATARSLGGRPLSGTDIVLHELWPLAGSRRPRTVAIALLATVWLIALPIMLSQVPIGFSPHQLLGAGGPALGLAGLAYLSWANFWLEPSRVNLNRLRTPRGRRGLAVGLAVWIAVGLTGGLVVGLAVGLTSLLPVGLAVWLVVGLTVGLAVGLTVGLTESASVGTPDPRSVIRNDLTSGLVFGLALGLAVGLPLGLTVGLVFGLTAGLGLGLTAGLASGTAGGPTGLRYVGLLLLTRRRRGNWLPWRLGRFLDACYQAGLIRIAGNAYQFRHRELQDYLVRHGNTTTRRPTPTP
jgi:hypothetical protein